MNTRQEYLNADYEDRAEFDNDIRRASRWAQTSPQRAVEKAFDFARWEWVVRVYVNDQIVDEVRSGGEYYAGIAFETRTFVGTHAS